MSVGFQAFLKGTSFDVLNSMSFNFIADIKYVSGNGSTTYSLPGFTLSAALMNTYSGQGTSGDSYTVSVSGQTVTWNVKNTSKLIVTATPTAGADSGMYFGFSMYDYSTNPRTFKIAPDFTPYNLAQVIDVSPAYDQIFQTNIPASVPIMAFHRATGSTYDHVWWTEINQNGYWAFKFRSNTGLNAMQACRIYIFAKLLINNPVWGFFLYKNGSMVWHNNCLPLKMNILNGGTVTSAAQPLAISNGVTSARAIQTDPSVPGTYTTWYECASAGRDSSGNYAATTLDRYFQNIIPSPSLPPSWVAGTVGYIECDIYDAYYRQALGV